MNFRTTILLLVVLVAAATLYFVTSGNKPAETETKSDPAGQAGKKLLADVPNAGAVNKVVVTHAGGERLAFERGAGASEWRIVEPVKGPAEAFQVDNLVREIIDLRTTGTTGAEGKGLDQPRYVIELTDKDNKTTRINVGNASSVGDILYVRVGDQSQADIVSSNVIEQLEKPAGEYRKARLLTVSNDKITGVTVAQKDAPPLKLSKNGAQWQITEPKPMPGDEAQIAALLSAITGLDAVKFVAEEAKDLAEFGLDKPQMSVTFTTAPPETQPSTSPSTASTKPTGGDVTTIKFGDAQDVLNKHVYAIASPSGPVVTIDATRLDAFKKTPLDLRDRKVLDVDPNAVSKLSITVDKPATTQPTTQPASKREVVLERRSESATDTQATPPAAGPAAPNPASATPAAPQSRGKTPDGGATVSLAAFQAEVLSKAKSEEKPATTTAATTKPATAPTTQPAAPKTKWVITSDPKGDANDVNVQSLLDALRPLRAEKFLEKFPTTQAAPAATYVVKIHTRSWGDEPAREQELKITEPAGAEAKLIGQLGELAFELDRGILEKLTAEFAAPKLAPAGPLFTPPAPAQSAPTLPAPAPSEPAPPARSEPATPAPGS